MAKETIQEAIGKFIYKERTRQKMSMAALSLKAHGSVGFATRISKIEKGLLRDCSINTYSLILAALGFDMRDLFK